MVALHASQGGHRTTLTWKKMYIYCGGKSPNWYIGPWALFKDMDTSEEE